MTPLLFALVAPALAQSDAWEDHYNQAKFFARKGWYDDAAEELERALAADGGQESFDVWWLAVEIRYERMDALGARDAALAAAEVAVEDAERAQARGLAQNLSNNYGALRVEGPKDGVRSIVQLEREGLLLDPEMKKFVDRVALDWRSERELPTEIGLPIGAYRVNGQLVEVRAGETATLTLAMDELGAAGLASLQVPRLEMALGVSTLSSLRVSNLQPGMESQLGFTYPLGGWLLGAVASYTVRSYLVDGVGVASDPWSWSGGLRVGRELYVGGPLAIRPSVGYRYGYVSGVPLACGDADPAGEFNCDDPALIQDPAAHVYATSLAHIPSLELSVSYRQAGRTTATGFGVRAAVDQAYGALPASDEAQSAVGSSTWNAAEQRWTATGVRLLGEISFTL